jgi:uncharacterized protein
MLCPTDGATLVMSERSGIEIDYCPTCRGVWLDRGELDKIIERSLGSSPGEPAPPRREEPRREQARYDQPRYEERHDRRYEQPYRKKRKESWLSELFD